MIFFTSGSTSVPKGVEISYYSFIYSAHETIKNLNYRIKQEVFADYHDSSFVMSLNIIFPAVYLDSTISPLTNNLDKMNPLEHVKKNKITVLITVPSFFLYIQNFLKKKISINKIILCGENFSFNVFNLLIKKIKFNSLFNCYGATELSPWAFYYEYKKKDYKIIKQNNQVPIGKKFKGLTTFINSERELCISGPVLSKGYVVKKQNKERFFFKKRRRFYNTGDICKIFMKTFTFVVGRNDKQIKVRGYRINTLEIEKSARKNNGVQFAYCFKKRNEEKLILLIVCSVKITENFIANNLKKDLPSYMIPQEIVINKKIKLNKNGKVDRVYYYNKYS